MKVFLIHAPNEEEWMECKQRALVTIKGKGLTLPTKEPASEWKRKILEARHSPIRILRYSFLLVGIPSNVSVHLCRHVHAQPYVSSLRNDRQEEIDGDKAPRDTPVNMIIDTNAEELMVMANKRLCQKAAKATRDVVRLMCDKAIEATPELEGNLVPMCKYHGGTCHEMQPCNLIREAQR